MPSFHRDVLFCCGMQLRCDSLADISPGFAGGFAGVNRCFKAMAGFAQ
jgi:hypothetical protein